MHRLSQPCSKQEPYLLVLTLASLLQTLQFIHLNLGNIFLRAGISGIYGRGFIFRIFGFHLQLNIFLLVNTPYPDFPTFPRSRSRSFPRTLSQTSAIHFALTVPHIRGLKSPFYSCEIPLWEVLDRVTPPSPGSHLSGKLIRTLGWRTL